LPDVDEPDALPPSLHYGNFDFLCTVISVVTYLADLIMDIIVCVYFYHLAVDSRHFWYFGLTLAFILLPSLTMTGFSFRWYLMDADNADLERVPLWKWILRLVVLMLQIAPILRYLDSMRYGIMSRWFARKERMARPDDLEARENARRERLRYYTLMVYEDADATLLRLFECFMESAPQLVLQIYILLKDRQAAQFDDNVDDEGEGRIVKISIFSVSVVSSLISLAWSLVVYHRSLRYTYPDKKNIRCGGSVLQFLWHFSSISARVLALSLFATAFPRWVGPVCAAHVLLMTTWILAQRVDACSTAGETLLFALVLGVVYIFSFFNAKEERTRYKYLFYYSFCFLENTALVAAWFHARDDDVADDTEWYRLPGIVFHYVAFFAGLCFMLLYYGLFHPTGPVKVDLPRLFRRNKSGDGDGRSPPPHQDEEEEAGGGAENGITLREINNGSPAAPTPRLETRLSLSHSKSTPSVADEPDGGAHSGGEKGTAANAKHGELLKRSLSEPPWPRNGTAGARTIKAMGSRQHSKTKNA